MKDHGALASRKATTDCYEFTMESLLIQEAETRHKKILDADYSAVDIREYVEDIPLLDKTQKKSLVKILEKYKSAFKGGLGDSKIEPVHLELKPGAKPYYAKAFPIPKPMNILLKRRVGGLKERACGITTATPNGHLLHLSKQRKQEMSGC